MTRPEFDRDDRTGPGGRPAVKCNGWCAATLFVDGVETVTLNPLPFGMLNEAQASGLAPLSAQARTFRKVRKTACSTTLRPSDASGLGLDIDEQRALEAQWKLLLSTRDCIIAESTRTTHDMSLVFAEFVAIDGAEEQSWSLAAGRVRVRRMELLRGSSVALRRSITSAPELSRPLFIDSGGSPSSFRFFWGRRMLVAGTDRAGIATSDLLRAHTDIALRSDPDEMPSQTRILLRSLLSDPAVPASDTGWETAEFFLRSLRPRHVSQADRDLLLQLIADRRAEELSGLWDAIRALGDDASSLRSSMIERLLRAATNDNSSALRDLGRAVGDLPNGTFEVITSMEKALLADPEARRRAPGLVRRQSDRGRGAAPILAAIAEFHARTWDASRMMTKPAAALREKDAALVDAARVALCRLGSEGSAALPGLLALDEGGLLTGKLSSDDDWALTLARLGQPVDALIKPK